MRRAVSLGRSALVVASVVVLWGVGCQGDGGRGAAPGGQDRFERCDGAADVLACQKEFLEERGIQACWTGRPAEPRCVILGMTLLESQGACEEELGEFLDFRRAIPSCREIQGQVPADQEEFDALYVRVMASWVEFELDDHGELEVVLRYLALRPGFVAPIIAELNESNQTYLRARDAVRELLSQERLRSLD